MDLKLPIWIHQVLTILISDLGCPVFTNHTNNCIVSFDGYIIGNELSSLCVQIFRFACVLLKAAQFQYLGVWGSTYAVCHLQ
jgi:hypothetical protein